MTETIEQTLLRRLADLGLAQRLRLTDGSWQLVSEVGNERPVRLDFAAQVQQLRPTLTSLKAQPLFRALGSKGGQRPKVWDVTCGLGGDALLLLLCGCSVVSTERHPLPALMLLRAYEQWRDPLKDQWLLDLSGKEYGTESEVIYFDPMYNGPESSALPRKEMRIFREVLGGDEDAQEVAQRLRAMGRRLIIKRPPKVPELLAGVSFAQEGKAVRFDVYLP